MKPISQTRCVVTLLLGCFAWASQTTNADERPNVVLIFSDDQGIGDVGCYGGDIPTPNIDQIAEQGIRFDRWYSASSICTPSRYGLLTGRNPIRSSDQLLSALMFLSPEDQRRGIEPTAFTLGDLFASHGYATAAIGKWHLGHGDPSFHPLRHGFQIFRGHTGGCIDYFTMTYGRTNDWYENESLVPKNGYATELMTDEAVSFIEDRKTRDKPYFLYLAYNAPHFGKGWNPPKNETVNIMQAQAKDLQRVAFIKDKIRREFAAMVVSLDDGIGRVLDAIDRSSRADDTLVIFLTDHGGDPVYGGNNGSLRGDKATLFEGGLRVPCLVRWPRRIEAGGQSRRVCSSLDWFPTFRKLIATTRTSSILDGEMLPELIGADASPSSPRRLVWQTGRHAELDRGTWTASLDGDWKYVQDGSGNEYLFDLTTDPNEAQNLSVAYPERLADQRRQTQRTIEAMRPKP